MLGVSSQGEGAAEVAFTDGRVVEYRRAFISSFFLSLLLLLALPASFAAFPPAPRQSCRRSGSGRRQIPEFVCGVWGLVFRI